MFGLASPHAYRTASSRLHQRGALAHRRRRGDRPSVRRPGRRPARPAGLADRPGLRRPRCGKPRGAHPGDRRGHGAARRGRALARRGGTRDRRPGAEDAAPHALRPHRRPRPGHGRPPALGRAHAVDDRRRRAARDLLRPVPAAVPDCAPFAIADLRRRGLHRPAGGAGDAGLRADRPVRARPVAQVRRQEFGAPAEGLRLLRRRVPRFRSRAWPR